MDLVTVGPGAGSSNTAPRITFSYAPASIQGLAESTGVARDSGQSSGHQISAMPAQEPSSTASGESRRGRGGEGAAATSTGGVRCYESRCAAPPKSLPASWQLPSGWVHEARTAGAPTQPFWLLARARQAFREPCACRLRIPRVHLSQEVRRLQSGGGGYYAQS